MLQPSPPRELLGHFSCLFLDLKISSLVQIKIQAREELWGHNDCLIFGNEYYDVLRFILWSQDIRVWAALLVKFGMRLERAYRQFFSGCVRLKTKQCKRLRHSSTKLYTSIPGTAKGCSTGKLQPARKKVLHVINIWDATLLVLHSFFCSNDPTGKGTFVVNTGSLQQVTRVSLIPEALMSYEKCENPPKQA